MTPFSIAGRVRLMWIAVVAVLALVISLIVVVARDDAGDESAPPPSSAAADSNEAGSSADSTDPSPGDTDEGGDTSSIEVQDAAVDARPGVENGDTAGSSAPVAPQPSDRAIRNDDASDVTNTTGATPTSGVAPTTGGEVIPTSGTRPTPTLTPATTPSPDPTKASPTSASEPAGSSQPSAPPAPPEAPGPPRQTPEPADPPESGGERHAVLEFDNPSLLLEPGGKGTARLFARYDDGTEIPVPIPSKEALVVSGSGSVASVQVAGGAIAVTAGSTIGSINITVLTLQLQLPAGTEPATPTLFAQTALFQQGVQTLTNKQIAFPPPDAVVPDGSGDDLTPEALGLDARGIGTFTWDQIVSRYDVQVPDDDDIAGVVRLRMPVVLRGAAPAIGSKVMAVEGAPVMGVVQGPIVTGTVDDHAAYLVTVELADPTLILKEYRFSVSEPARGAPQPFRSLAGSALREGDEPPPPETPPQTPPEDPSDPGKVADDSSCYIDGADDPDAKDDPNIRFTKSVTPKVNLSKRDLDLQFTATEGLKRVALVAGVDASLTGTIGVSIGRQLSVKIICELYEGPLLQIKLPPPAGLIFAPSAESKLVSETVVSLEVGPQIALSGSLTWGLKGDLGFIWTPGTGFDGVNTLAATELKPDWSATGDTDLLNSPLKFSATTGVFWQPRFGLTIGGYIADFMKAVSKFPFITEASRKELNELLNLCNIYPLVGDIGPYAEFTYENKAAVLANEKAESQFGLKARMKLEVSFTDVNRILRFAGLGALQLPNTLPIPFLSTAFNLGGFLNHLEGSPEIRVNGIKVAKDSDGVLDKVEVQPKDTAIMRVPLTAKPEWLTSAGDATLKRMIIYERNASFWVESNQFKLTGSGSEVSATLPPTITDQCTETEPKEQTFFLMPMSEGLLEDELPGFAGKFTVRCSVPKLVASHDGNPIGDTPLEGDDGSQIAVQVRGVDLHRPYDYTLSTSSPWLTITPATAGSIGPTEDAVDESDNAISANPVVDHVLAIECGTLKEDESGSVTVTPTDSKGVLRSIRIPIVAHCADKLVIEPSSVTMDASSMDKTVTLQSNSSKSRTWSARMPDWLYIVEHTDANGQASGELEAGEQNLELTVRRYGAIDPETCDADGTKRATIDIRAKAADGRTSVTSLTVTYRCKDPVLRFDPKTVHVYRDKPVTVNIIGSYLAGPTSVNLVNDLASDGLVISRTTATLVAGAPDSPPVPVIISCGEGARSRKTGLVVGVATGEGIVPAETASVQVQMMCDSEFDVSPTELEGRSGNVTVHWSLPTGRGLRWTMSGLPEWLVATPQAGKEWDTGYYSAVNEGDLKVYFTATNRSRQQCGAPARVQKASITITGYESPPGDVTQTDLVELGQHTIVYTFTEPAGPSCHPKPTGPTGRGDKDPHMTGFNGTRYDAQVVGEYTMVTPMAGAEGPVIQARWELTADGASASSISAVALQSEGHVLELYARPDFAVFLDGEEIKIGPDEMVEISESASIVKGADSATISGDGYLMEIYRWKWGGDAPYNFDLSVRVNDGAPVWGLFGTPSGEPQGDRLRSDYVVDLPFDWFDTIGGGQDAVLRFTDSWRLKNRSQSLLTSRYSAVFDAPNPTPMTLQELLDAVALIRAQVPAICAAGDPAVLERVERELAVELWAQYGAADQITAADVASVIAGNRRLLCTYSVSGTVTLADENATSSLAGLRLLVDVDGIGSCVTITAASGAYACTVAPDPAGNKPDAGPAVTVTVMDPENTAAALAVGHAAFSSVPAMGGSASVQVDLVVDADALPTAVIEGTLIDSEGAPMSGPICLDVEERVGDEYRYGRRLSVRPDATTGRFSITLRLSTAPQELRFTTCGTSGIFNWGFWSRTVPLTGHLSYIDLSFAVIDLPAVVISGTLTRGGVGNPGPLALSLSEHNQAGTNVLSSRRVDITPDPVTGFYRVVVPLYTDPYQISVMPLQGTFEDWGINSAAVVINRATQYTPLNISFDTESLPTVTVSGHIMVDGAPSAARSLGVTEDISGPGATAPSWGNYRQISIEPDPEDGSFTTTLHLWKTPPKAISFVPTPALAGWDTYLPRTFALANEDQQDITIDYDVSLMPHVAVSGVMKSLGQPMNGPVTVMISEQQADPRIGPYDQAATVTPDPADGSYELTVPLYVTPVTAIKVWLPYVTGFERAYRPSTPLDPVASTQNVVINFDDSAQSVTLFGADSIPANLVSGGFSYGFRIDDDVTAGVSQNVVSQVWLDLTDADDRALLGDTVAIPSQYHNVWYSVSWTDDHGEHALRGSLPVPPGGAVVMPDPWHNPSGAVIRLQRADDDEFTDRCSGAPAAAFRSPSAAIGDDNDWCSKYRRVLAQIREYAGDAVVAVRETGISFDLDSWDHTVDRAWLTARAGTDRVEIVYRNGFYPEAGTVVAAIDLAHDPLLMTLPAPEPPPADSEGKPTVTFTGFDHLPNDVTEAYLGYQFVADPDTYLQTGRYSEGTWYEIDVTAANHLDGTIEAWEPYGDSPVFDWVWYEVTWTDGAGEHRANGVVPVAAGRLAMLYAPWVEPEEDASVLRLALPGTDPAYADNCSSEGGVQAWCHTYRSTAVEVIERDADGEIVRREPDAGLFNPDPRSDWVDSPRRSADEYWLGLDPDTASVEVWYSGGFYEEPRLISTLDRRDADGEPEILPFPNAPANAFAGQIHLQGAWPRLNGLIDWRYMRIAVLSADGSEVLIPYFIPYYNDEEWPEGVTGTADYDEGYDLWIAIPDAPPTVRLAYRSSDWDGHIALIDDVLDLSGGTVQLEFPEVEYVETSVTFLDSDGDRYQGNVDVQVGVGYEADAEWDELPFHFDLGTRATVDWAQDVISVSFVIRHGSHTYMQIKGVPTGWDVGTGGLGRFDVDSDPEDYHVGGSGFDIYPVTIVFAGAVGGDGINSLPADPDGEPSPPEPAVIPPEPGPAGDTTEDEGAGGQTGEDDSGQAGPGQAAPRESDPGEGDQDDEDDQGGSDQGGGEEGPRPEDPPEGAGGGEEDGAAP